MIVSGLEGHQPGTPRPTGVVSVEAPSLGTDDARIAAEAAQALTGSGSARSAVNTKEVFSTLGAALLRTGWSADLALLSAPCLVVKPG